MKLSAKIRCPNTAGIPTGKLIWQSLSTWSTEWKEFNVGSRSYSGHVVLSEDGSLILRKFWLNISEMVLTEDIGKNNKSPETGNLIFQYTDYIREYNWGVIVCKRTGNSDIACRPEGIHVILNICLSKFVIIQKW